MDIVITVADAGDCTWAAQLMASSEPWRTLGRGLEASLAYLGPHPDGELLIGRRNAARCGFVYVRPRGFAGAPYIASIGVAPDHRNLGVGTALLVHAESRYSPHAQHIFLLVSSFNTGARRLYERLGYRAVGELPDFIVAGAAEVIMHKRLAS